MNKKGFYSIIALVTLILAGMTFYQLKGQQPTTEKEDLKVVMITDSGSIDDKSFNQGTWEGIKRYESEFQTIDASYLTPADNSTESFLNSIDNAVLSGAEVIVTPGFSFEEAIGKAQNQYPNVKFVLIDGQPLVGSEYNVEKNTQSIFFKEQEASFLTGVATALASKTGKVGFIGGVKVPAVEKLGWGYVAGIAYANKVLKTDTQIVDFIYQGTFDDAQAGQMLASGMFDKGADIILQAAGLVGVGAMAEAKLRTGAGDEVYIVGVDIDQYESGLMNNDQSIILTSAMKKLDEAVYQALTDIESDSFKGGTTHVLGIVENGVGLPLENPNLTDNIITTVESVKELIEAGEIIVPATLEETKQFLNEKGMDSSSLKE